MSQVSKWAGPLTVILLVASLASLGYYQFIYMPIANAEVEVPQEWLEPPEESIIEIIIGSVNQDQEENYVPREITVKLGINNRVIWKNIDSIIHTVSADSGAEEEFEEEAGRANFLDPDGGEFSFTFTMPGEYFYHCEPHPWMRGTVIVLEPEA